MYQGDRDTRRGKKATGGEKVNTQTKNIFWDKKHGTYAQARRASRLNGGGYNLRHDYKKNKKKKKKKTGKHDSDCRELDGGGLAVNGL